MQYLQYLKTIAATLNAVLFLTALMHVGDMRRPIKDGGELLFLILVVVTPAFTLFVMCAPAKEQ